MRLGDFFGEDRRRKDKPVFNPLVYAERFDQRPPSLSFCRPVFDPMWGCFLSLVHGFDNYREFFEFFCLRNLFYDLLLETIFLQTVPEGTRRQPK